MWWHAKEMTAADAKAIDDYLAKQPENDRSIISPYYEHARKLVPTAEPGHSYGMAALLYKGKGLVSLMTTAKGYSVIPFSGQVHKHISGLKTSEKGGSIYFTADDPLPMDTFDEILRARIAEIDSKKK
jgi:uncharacterized protein YdhG (YjbR/CyaY superfamily)